MKLLLNWILSACALLLVASVYSGLQVHSFGSALWAVAVISLLNLLVRPILVVLTLPVTLVTLGTAIAVLIYFQLVRHLVDPVVGLKRFRLTSRPPAGWNDLLKL